MVLAGFEEERDVGDPDSCARRKIREPLADTPIDFGVDDGLELRARDPIGENDASERGTIQRAVGLYFAKA